MPIRPVTPDDLAAVVAVKIAAIRPVYEPLASPELFEDYDLDEQTAWLGHVLDTVGDDDPLLVAVDDAGAVIGWIRLGRDGHGGDRSAEIRGLFVHPAAHASGIGRALVRAGAAHMQGRGFRRLKVNTLTGSRACTFYERVGGVPDGEVPFRGGFTESVYRWSDIAVAAQIVT